MRLIHTSDWHFGAGFDNWEEDLAARRRQEREAAVQQILDYAIHENADYLVVAGDVCDFPEEMPESIVDGLDAARRSGCVPVLLFTNAGHDGNREWWAGTAMGPYKGHPRHKAVEGRGYRLPHTAIFDNVAFAAFDHLPSVGELQPLEGLGVPRVLLLHAQVGATDRRLDPWRSLFAYVACGDCHAHEALVPGFAYYSGSPSFRDLASIDPGPRSFLDVRLQQGAPAEVQRVAIDTPLSAVLTIEDGGVRLTPHFDVRDHASLGEALSRLPANYAYVKLSVQPEQQAAFDAAVAEGALAGWRRVPSWTKTATLLVREAG